MPCRHLTVSLLVLAATGFAGPTSEALAQQSAPPAAAKPAPARAAPAKPAAAKPAPAAAAPAASQAAAAVGGQPLLLGQYGDWGAYTATPSGRKVCFALAKPTATQTSPANRPRDPSYMFIASRPTEKVKDEVSIIMGYGFKPSADAQVDLSGGTFAMYTQNDGAWIKNAAEEPRLIDAMRKSPELTVKGQSARGTSSTDTYSLKGLAQALDRVGQECR